MTGAGVIGVIAAGAIAGILKSGSPGGGVAHTVVTPAALGPYKWAPDLEKNIGLPTLATSVAKMSDGQTSDIRARAPGDLDYVDLLEQHLEQDGSSRPRSCSMLPAIRAPGMSDRRWA